MTGRERRPFHGQGFDASLPIRTGYLTCPKGSKMRALLLLALRPQGVQVSEAIRLGIINTANAALVIMGQAEFHCGYDVRHIGRRKSKNPEAITYHLVGKHRWSGEYHSFRPAGDTWPNVRNDSPSWKPHEPQAF